METNNKQKKETGDLNNSQKVNAVALYYIYRNIDCPFRFSNHHWSAAIALLFIEFDSAYFLGLINGYLTFHPLGTE